MITEGDEHFPHFFSYFWVIYLKLCELIPFLGLGYWMYPDFCNGRYYFYFRDELQKAKPGMASPSRFLEIGFYRVVRAGHALFK